MCTGIMSCTVRIYLTPKLQYDDEGDDGDCGYDDVDNNDKQIRKLQNHHHAIICTKNHCCLVIKYGHTVNVVQEVDVVFSFKG